MEKIIEKLSTFRVELVKERLHHEVSHNVKEFYMHNALSYESRTYILGKLESYLKALVDTEQLSEVKASDILELERYDLANTSMKELVKFHFGIDLQEKNYN